MTIDITARRRDAAGRRRATRSSARDGSAASSPADLATRFGTPLYVYDLDVVERQLDGADRPSCRPRSSWPTRSRRTRPWRSWLTSAGSGLGADVASGGELATVAPGGDRRRIGS